MLHENAAAIYSIWQKQIVFHYESLAGELATELIIKIMETLKMMSLGFR